MPFDIDYVKHVQPRESLASDAAIATAIEASRLTRRNIPITGSGSEQRKSIHFLLTAVFPVMTMGNSQDWQGPLIDLRATDSGINQAMGLLISYLQVEGRVLSSAEDEQSAQMLYLVQEAVKTIAPNLPSPYTATAAQVDVAVNAITGGRLFDGITASDVAACRTAHQSATTEQNRSAAIQARWDGLYDSIVAPALADGSSTVANVETALVAELS